MPTIDEILAGASRETTREDVRDYLGPVASEEVVEAATDIAWRLATLKDSDARRLAVEALGAFMCLHCGGAHLPCYCMRDD